MLYIHKKERKGFAITVEYRVGPYGHLITQIW